MWRFRAGLEDLKTYSVEEADWSVKLDANERAENLPEAVRQRIAEKLAVLPFNRYPEITQYSFRSKLAAGFGMDTDNVLIGNGSSQLLQALCFVYGGMGRKIVFPTPSFSMYSIYCKLADSLPVPVQLEEDYTLSPEKVLEAAKSSGAGLIILCTPNNPTGTLMTHEAVEYVVARAECPVVVDEAYYEFAGQTAINLLGRYPNVVIVRTFSKAYGLASARVGYSLADKAISGLVSKVLMPYNINTMSLTAAETVFEMKDEFAASIAMTVAERERLAAALAGLEGVKVYSSATNFILFKSARANDLAKYLTASGIGIRDFSSAPGLENGIRVTVGTPEENVIFLKRVTDFLKK